MNEQLDAEEREILEHFERGELQLADDATNEIKAARRAARDTLNKTGRANLRVTEPDQNISAIDRNPSV